MYLHAGADIMTMETTVQCGYARDLFLHFLDPVLRSKRMNFGVQVDPGEHSLFGRQPCPRSYLAYATLISTFY